MRLPFNPARPRIRRITFALAAVLTILIAWSVGYVKGEAHVTSEVQAGAAAAEAKSIVTASRTTMTRYCADYFGSSSEITRQFGSPTLEIDVKSSIAETGRVICAYRSPHKSNDELVLILTSTKPNNLVGKMGVLSETVVRGAPSHGSIFALAASTDARVPITGADDAWLLAAAQRTLA